MIRAYAVVQQSTRAVKLVTRDERNALELCAALTKDGDLYLVAAKDVADEAAFEAVKALATGNATMGKVKGE